MKHSLSSTLTAATLLSVALLPSLPAAEAAGYVDFGKFSAGPASRLVEVNVRPGLLKFAAKLAAAHEPDAAELLRNIKHVRVNVVGLDESNKAATVARMESIRSELEQRGWEKVVTAREPRPEGSDDVAIYTMSDDETILGLVVTVLEHKGNAVFVNVVGNIRAEELARLGEKLDLKPLRKLKVPPKDSPPHQDSSQS